MPQICEMLNALTGWKFEPEELLAAGDRSVALKRAISNKFGVTRDHDILPKICLEPLNEGTHRRHPSGHGEDAQRVLPVPGLGLANRQTHQR